MIVSTDNIPAERMKIDKSLFQGKRFNVHRAALILKKDMIDFTEAKVISHRASSQPYHL